MVTINDELLKNLKADLESIINGSIKKLYDQENDLCNITLNIGIGLSEEDNEVTGEQEKVPQIAYELKNKIYKKPIETKIKGYTTNDYFILIDEEDEVVIKKREKAQLELEEESQKSCDLHKTKHQDISRCKKRKNDSCEKCKHYN